MMRLHRNLVFTVIDSLNLIFNEGVYADKAVEAALKKDARWGARDRKFVAETIYEIVRWKRLYNEITETKEHYSRENLGRFLRYGPCSEELNCQTGNIFQMLQKDASRENLTKYKKSEKSKNLSQIGWMI